MRQTSLQSYFIREQVIKAIRAFFDQQNFHEVIPPILNKSVPLEPTIYPFKTTWNTLNGDKDFYLPTSPEGAMKQIIAAGIGNCYSLGKCFRNLENSGDRHSPEFMMLEWYRQDEDYFQIMKDVQELIKFIKNWLNQSTTLIYQNITVSLDTNWPVISLDDLFEQYLGVRIKNILELNAIKELAAARGYSLETDLKSETNLWEQLFNQIIVNQIEPKLPDDQVFFMIDFPSRLSPLCGIKPAASHLAERFELYIAGMEIGNGMNEQLDSTVIENFYQQEAAARSEQQLDVPPPNIDFYQALDEMKASGHSFAGMGLGLDRLVMLMADKINISDVDFFAVG
jgi:elongation factor P--beta-lysine ligase